MKTTSYEVPATRKTVALLKCLCESEAPMSLTEIVRALGTNKNMAFRLLRTLVDEGWIIQEDGPTYRVSLQPFHYFSKPVGRMDLRTSAHEPLHQLWQETRESCYLGVLDEDRVLYLEHLDGKQAIRTSASVGGRYHLHCSAPGKVLLAHAERDLLERLSSAGLERNTSATICGRAALKRELKKVRQHGYAVDDEEYVRGLICFAAPIYDHTDRVVGSVGIAVLTLHYTAAEFVAALGPRVMRAAETISMRMGMSETAVDRFRLNPGAE